MNVIADSVSLRSDCVDAKADMDRHSPHMSEGGPFSCEASLIHELHMLQNIISKIVMCTKIFVCIYIPIYKRLHENLQSSFRKTEHSYYSS